MSIIKSKNLKKIEDKVLASKSRTFTDRNIKVTFKDDNSSLRSPFQYYLLVDGSWKNIKLLEFEKALHEEMV